MAELGNLARMSTATTGTGTITLGSAASGHLTFAEAGITDGQTVSYAIEDGSSSEVGRGVYTSAGTTLTRSVLKSTNSNNAINLSGTAEVFITALAEDFTRRLISEVVTSASQASVTFSSIPQGYRDLEIRVRGRGDAAGVNERQIALQFNGDTASNYHYSNAYIQNGGAGATSDNDHTAIFCCRIPAATATASHASGAMITIFDYRGTTFYKHVRGSGGESKTTAAGDQNAQMGHGMWESTAAITSILVFLESGNFVDNSVVSLYGLL